MMQEALEKQTRLLMKIAKRLDEVGYAVVVNSLNPEGKDQDYLYGYFVSALLKFVPAITKARNATGPRTGRKYPLIIYLSPERVRDGNKRVWVVPHSRYNNILDFPFYFECNIPKVHQLKAIHVALGLATTNKVDNATYNGRRGLKQDRLGIVDKTNSIEYRGWHKDHLTILLTILNMPHHRDLLCGRG